MPTSFYIEAFGYLGSFIVLVSFLMTSVFKLRVVNTVGSVIFMTYALIIHSYPTALMNFCLVLINLRFLIKMSRGSKDYELVRVEPDDSYLRHMLTTYSEDIEKCFPGVELPGAGSGNIDYSYIINCQNKPAGFFLASGQPDDVEVLLDYSTPEYRDFSLGSYLMSQLKSAGVKKLRYTGPAENHMEYLKKMGFEEAGSPGDGQGSADSHGTVYVKEL